MAKNASMNNKSKSEKKNKKSERSMSTVSMQLSVSSFVTKCVAMLSGMIIARVLSKPDFTIYNQALLLFVTLMPFLQCGITNGIYYYLTTEKERFRGRVNESYALLMITGTIYSLFILCGGNVLIANLWETPELKFLLPWTVPYVYLDLLNYTSMAVFNLRNKIKTYMIYSMIGLTVQSVGLTTAIVISPTPQTAVIAFIVLGSINRLIGILLSRRVVPRDNAKPTLAGMWEMFRFSFPLGISSSLDVLTGQMDNWFINTMRTKEEAADYKVGSHEMSLISVVTASVNAAALPEIRKRAAEGDLRGCYRLYRSISRKFATMLVPMMCVFFIWGKEFITLFFGDKYAESTIIFQIYLLFYLVRISITHPIFASLGMRAYIFWRAVGTIIINFFLNFLFIPLFGPFGAATATIASVTLVYIFSNVPALARALKVKNSQIYPLGLVSSLLALWMGGGYLFKIFIAEPVIGGAVKAINIGGKINELISSIAISIGLNREFTGDWFDRALTTGFSGLFYFIIFGFLCYGFFRPDYRWMGNNFGKYFDKIFGKIYKKLFKKQIARRTERAAVSDDVKNRILYISFEHADDAASGVNRKIAAQIKAFSDAGLKVTKIAQTSGGAVISNDKEEKNIPFEQNDLHPLLRKLPFKLANRVFLCNQAANQAGEHGSVYMRFQFFSPDVLFMLKKLKSRGAKVVVEIPTYPYWRELTAQGKSGIAKLICDKFYLGFCSNYIDVFASPLYHDEISGRPCIPIMNGVDFSQVSVRNPEHTKDEIHMLAVALMAPWHGYDRVIEGMGRYKKTVGAPLAVSAKGATYGTHTGRASATRTDVYLHLVGDGAEIPRYRRLAKNLGISDRVIFHGKLFGDELSALYNKCDVSISTLACHRKKMERDYREGSLKHIEAFAKGIPVVASSPAPKQRLVDSDVDSYLIGKSLRESTPPESLTRFDIAVAEDESPVDISRIVDFVDDLHGEFSPDELAAQIRALGEEKYDIHATQKNVVNWILNN